MQAENVIDVKNLSLKAGYRYLLKDINWQVARGEHWLLFGMNGSGKTTLLSILAGYRAATSGHFTVLGESYTPENILDLRKRIGWVSGSFFEQKYSRESALDIVLSGLTRALGRDSRLIDNKDVKRAMALLKELHLGSKIYQPFHMMSRGERQNVLIARALLAKPALLLLDEPCTGLDILAREHLLNTLKDLAHNSDMTIIYVTHYTEEILLDLFKKTMLLKDGMSFAQGETTALFNDALFSDFMDAPTHISKRAWHGLEANVETCSHVAALMKEV